jgi:ribosomal protein L37AE/L43A
MPKLQLVHQTRFATCPLCHTSDAELTLEALEAGGYWQCTTCRQTWTALRLATAATYATWSAAHDLRTADAAAAVLAR